jgi:hypothetical protein
LFWKNKADEIIKQEYAEFSRAEGLKNSPDAGHIFAMRKARDGYRDRSERDLILLVSGALPFMYD